MTRSQENVFLLMQAMVLAYEKSDEKRMKLLDDFARSTGFSIRNWTERLKEALRKEENSEEAIRTLERFCAKNEVRDEKGYVFYRRTFGNELHHVTVTYDRSKPEGEQFAVEEYPDLSSMSLPELEEYLDEVETALMAREDEEPNEDAEEHTAWEESCEELEDLMEEIEERIRELQPNAE